MLENTGFLPLIRGGGECVLGQSCNRFGSCHLSLRHDRRQGCRHSDCPNRHICVLLNPLSVPPKENPGTKQARKRPQDHAGNCTAWMVFNSVRAAKNSKRNPDSRANKYEELLSRSSD